MHELNLTHWTLFLFLFFTLGVFLRLQHTKQSKERERERKKVIFAWELCDAVLKPQIMNKIDFAKWQIHETMWRWSGIQTNMYNKMRTFYTHIHYPTLYSTCEQSLDRKMLFALSILPLIYLGYVPSWLEFSDDRKLRMSKFDHVMQSDCVIMIVFEI